MTGPLTQRQEEVLEAIRVVTARLGYAPSHRDLCVELGIQSTNAVSDHLLALEKRGRIARTPGVPRSLRVVDPPESRIGAAGSWSMPQGLTTRSRAMALLAATARALVNPTLDELYTVACLTESPEALDDSGVLSPSQVQALRAACGKWPGQLLSVVDWQRALTHCCACEYLVVLDDRRVVAGRRVSAIHADAWAMGRAGFAAWCWREHRDRLGTLLVRDALAPVRRDADGFFGVEVA